MKILSTIVIIVIAVIIFLLSANEKKEIPKIQNYNKKVVEVEKVKSQDLNLQVVSGSLFR